MEVGRKDDAGKIRASLVLEDFANALKSVSEVATFGAKKYAAHSWKNVPNAEERYKDAMIRHLLDHLSGDLIDKETRLTHLSHFTWNALALLELQQNKKGK
jgi:hypothetical protein